MPQSFGNYLLGEQEFNKLTPEKQLDVKMEVIIRLAMRKVKQNTHVNAGKLWKRTETQFEGVYNNKIILCVLEGDPVGGCVVANWHAGTAVVMDWRLGRINTFSIMKIDAEVLKNRCYDIILEKILK